MKCKFYILLNISVVIFSDFFNEKKPLIFFIKVIKIFKSLHIIQFKNDKISYFRI